MAFLDWFKYSENTIDGQSRKKAYTLWESNLVSSRDVGKAKSLQQINAYLYGGLYDFAGKKRILLKQALTDRINDREIFMKGIDYSYYYEQEE